MKNNNSFGGSDIYIIPILDKFILYSPLRNFSAFLNKRAVEIIARQWGSNTVDSSWPSSISELMDTLINTPAREPELPNGPLSPAFLGIVPTRTCNGACSYCGFGAAQASPDVMDLNLAVSAVEWMGQTAKAQGKTTLEVHFFGGEPFVTADVIDCVVHKTRALAAEMGLKPHLEVSTNGVVDETRTRWIGDYFNCVVLSLDGPEDIHDRQRPLRNGRGSFAFAAATAKVLSNSQAKLCLRCCITNKSVKHFEVITQWLCKEFNPGVINFETMVPTPEAHAAELFAPDPFDFASGYLNANGIAREYGVEQVNSSQLNSKPGRTICPVGKDTAIVTPDGRISSCYLPQEQYLKKGLNCDIGTIADGHINVNMPVVERLRNLLSEKARCKRCFCKWSCCGGCHVDVSWPGCPLEYSNHCIQTRLINACKLLSELGTDEWLDRFTKNRPAQERLAYFPSDRLEDWSG